MGRAYLILSTVTITIIPVKSWWRWCRLLKMIDRDDHDGHGDLMMIQPFLIVLDHIPDWHRSRFRLFLNSMLPLTASHLFKNFTKLSSVSDHLDFDRRVISPSSSKPSFNHNHDQGHLGLGLEVFRFPRQFDVQAHRGLRRHLKKRR